MTVLQSGVRFSKTHFVVVSVSDNKGLFVRQLLAKIYQMPSKPVFLGARLASLPMRTQERSMSTEDGLECVLQEFDDDTGETLISLVTLFLHMFDGFFCPQV